MADDDEIMEIDNFDNLKNLQIKVKNSGEENPAREVIVLEDDDEDEDDDDIDDGEIIENVLTDTESSVEKNDSDNGILFRVTFNDIEKYRLFKDSVLNGIRDNLKKHKQIDIDFIDDDRNLELCILEKSRKTITENDKENKNDDKKEETTANLNDDSLIFSIDITPTTSGRVEAGRVPSYRRTIKTVLEKRPNDNQQQSDQTPKQIRVTNTCFNCAGEHSVKDCREPKNQQKINRARKVFQGNRTERYHVDIEQKYAHLKPGQISGELRKALGLKERELPSFIYKMRLLGYPPGWLEDAKVHNSGLTLFGQDGRRILGSDDDEGEIDEENHKYDVNKIIDYPGFNVEPDFDYIEEGNSYGVPPMLYENKKEVFIRSFGSAISQAYKRKKLKNLPLSNDPDDDVVITATDMDVEIVNNDKPPLPIDCPPSPPPPPPPAPTTSDSALETTSSDSIIKTDIDDFDRKSPTLLDLEERKKELMATLNSSACLDSTATSNDDDSKSLINMDKIKAEIDDDDDDDDDIKPSTPIPDISMDDDDDDDSETNDSPKTPLRKGLAKISTFGTPLLKFSPFNELPSGEKFSKGVSDVINFENLPDSTGKYEQMKVVLQKVRKQLTTDD